MALHFVDRFSKKYSNIRFHENLSTGNRGVPSGWTDRHDKANSRFSQFCERAYTLNQRADCLRNSHLPLSARFF